MQSKPAEAILSILRKYVVIYICSYPNTLISPGHLIKYLDVVALVMESEGASVFPEAKQSHPARQRLLRRLAPA